MAADIFFLSITRSLKCILWYVLTPVYIWELISQETKLNHERRSQGRQRKQQIIFNSFIINCQLDIDWTCTIARSTTLKNLASGILFPNCVNVSSCFLWKERLAYQWPLLTVAFNWIHRIQMGTKKSNPKIKTPSVSYWFVNVERVLILLTELTSDRRLYTTKREGRDVRLAGIVKVYNSGFLHVMSNLKINNHWVHTRNLAPINSYLIDCLI